MLTALSS